MDEGHGDHIAIGNVRHFVSQDGLNFFVGHVLQQAGRNRDQGRVFEGAGCKCVGVTLKNTHFGHANSGLVGQFFDRIDQPFFVRIARLCNDLDTRAPLGNRLADEQGNESAAKAHDEGKAQQGG